jgi:hypothetical protein
MNKHPKIHRAKAIVQLMALGLLAAGAEASQTAQVIIDWNQVAQKNVSGPPFLQSRSYAMVHIAMADAVVAIDGQYKPFHARLKTPGPHNASAKAAAAQAARDVLVTLIPANQAAFDAALEASLEKIPAAQRAGGRKVGARVAKAVLKWRQNDGFVDANPQPPALLPSTLPGIWRQTKSGSAQFEELGSVTPFGLLSPTQFLPAPPPQLESAEYAADFNEVSDKGRSTGSTRSIEEERFAQLFAGAMGPYFNTTNQFRLWNNVARDVSQAEGMSLVRTARLFALMTASIHDSLQTAHTSKFIYRLWRPETAIAAADTDDNPDTAAEPGWIPLLSTPAYPSHASNMSCIGVGAAQMLANVFGTDTKTFDATWYTPDSPPAVVHSQPYSSFWALGQDEGSSRVWGGIHFRFEIDASEQSCAQVANYIYDNYMRRDGHKQP